MKIFTTTLTTASLPPSRAECTAGLLAISGLRHQKAHSPYVYIRLVRHLWHCTETSSSVSAVENIFHKFINQISISNLVLPTIQFFAAGNAALQSSLTIYVREGRMVSENKWICGGPLM